MGAHEFGTLKCIFVFHPAKISSDRVQTNMGLDEGIPFFFWEKIMGWGRGVFFLAVGFALVGQ